MPTPRQELEELRRLAAQYGEMPASKSTQSAPQGLTPRQELERLRQLAQSSQPQDIVQQIPTGIAGVTEQKYEPSIAGTQPEPTFGEKIVGAGEAALSTVTGATTGAIGYLGGAAKGIGSELLGAVTGEGPQPGSGYAEEQAMKGAEAGTYVPRTEAGKEYVGKVGETAQNLAPLAGLSGELQAIGSSLKNIGPQLKRGTTLIDDMGEPTPILRKALDDKGLVYENLSPQAKSAIPTQVTPDFLKSTKSEVLGIRDNALIEQIKSGARDDSLAGLKVVKDRVIPDKTANEAIRQGFEPGFVQAVKTASPATKSAMDDMLKMMERISKNRRLGMEFRPTDIAGKEVLNRVSYIKDKANIARKQLENIANNRLKGKPIDGEPVVNQLNKSLADLDISLDTSSSGLPKPNFKGSMISKDRTSQRVINDLVDLMAEGGKPDALRFHKLKRQLDTLIDYRKKSAGGLTDAGKSVLKDIRRSLNESLRASDIKYAEVNDVLSSSLTALDDFKNALGSSIDIFEPGANKAIGTDLRGLLSNRKTRIKLENSLDQLDSTANELGGKFNVNYKDLAMFSNGLEDRFGAIAKTSFQGGIESAVKNAQRAAAQGIKGAATEAAANKAADIANKMRGINDFNAFNSMRDLLNGK